MFKLLLWAWAFTVLCAFIKTTSRVYLRDSPSSTKVRIVMEPFSAWKRACVSWGNRVLTFVTFGNAPTDLESLMQHSAIIIDGEIYEFTVDGLIKHSKGSAAAVELERRDWPQNWEYTSRKSLVEFQQWAHKQTEYSKEAYDIRKNNCHDFVAGACNFLGTTVPNEIKQIISKYCNGPGWLGDVTLPVYAQQSNKQQEIWQVLVAELWASGVGA